MNEARIGDAIQSWPELNPKQQDQVRALVGAEIQNVLQELRDSFYGSGYEADYRIAERLDYLITARERADGEENTELAANPFEETEPGADERRRVTHAAMYLPVANLNALPAGAYKLLGNLVRSDAYTNAVVRLMQYGAPRIGSAQATESCDHIYDMEDDGNGHSGAPRSA